MRIHETGTKRNRKFELRCDAPQSFVTVLLVHLKMDLTVEVKRNEEYS
jgi:hypothetical protein